VMVILGVLFGDVLACRARGQVIGRVSGAGGFANGAEIAMWRAGFGAQDAIAGASVAVGSSTGCS
jgi:hypothetical protein